MLIPSSRRRDEFLSETQVVRQVKQRYFMVPSPKFRRIAEFANGHTEKTVEALSNGTVTVFRRSSATLTFYSVTHKPTESFQTQVSAFN